MTERTVDRWKHLRSSQHLGAVLEVPSIDSGVETGYGTARFAVGPTGQARLLVPAAQGSARESVGEAPRLALGSCRLTLEDRQTHYLDLMCLDASLEPVFAELVDDVLRRLEEGAAPAAAIANALRDFRRLLLESDGHAVADNEILGLVGELYVLTQLVKISPGAIEAWTGPFGQRHDFRRGSLALEVKTSGRAAATRITIHGIEQLACAAGEQLSLAHVRMERAAGGSASVATLCRYLADKNVDESRLRSALAALGCGSPDDPQWNRLAFQPVGVRLYGVTDGFPRLTANQLNDRQALNGIPRVEYDIELGAASAFLLPESAHKEYLMRIAREAS